MKPWTIFQAHPTCEDAFNGPYPLVNTPEYFASGQAWAGGADINGSTSTLNGGEGIAWQGDGIDSDMDETIKIYFGSWSGYTDDMPQPWGTGNMAFGNQDLFSTKTAQYALACGVAINVNGTKNPNELKSQLPGPSNFLLSADDIDEKHALHNNPSVAHNPNPAERMQMLWQNQADPPTITMHNRITLKEGVDRVIELQVPDGYKPVGDLLITPEHAPADMRQPSQDDLDGTSFSYSRHEWDDEANTLRYSLSVHDLVHTTMLHTQMTFVKEHFFPSEDPIIQAHEMDWL